MAKIDVSAEILRRVRSVVHSVKNELRDAGVPESELEGILVHEGNEGVLVHVPKTAATKKKVAEVKSGTKSQKPE